jgi:predicted DNA-binding protein
MPEKRVKTKELKIRLGDEIHARLMAMAKRRGIPASSLAITYITRGLENEEADFGQKRPATVLPEGGQLKKQKK